MICEILTLTVLITSEVLYGWPFSTLVHLPDTDLHVDLVTLTEEVPGMSFCAELTTNVNMA